MRTLGALLLTLTVVTGRTGSSDPPSADPTPLEVSWREMTLPMPPGREGRIAVRDAVRCGAGPD